MTMLDVLEMLTRDHSEAEQRAAENRIAFPFAAEWLDALKAAGMEARVVYATNGTREVGEWFEDRCKREGHTPCRYLPQGVQP